MNVTDLLSRDLLLAIRLGVPFDVTLRTAEGAVLASGQHPARLESGRVQFDTFVLTVLTSGRAYAVDFCLHNLVWRMDAASGLVHPGDTLRVEAAALMAERDGITLTAAVWAKWTGRAAT